MFSKSFLIFLNLAFCCTIFFFVVVETSSKGFFFNHFGSLKERNVIDNSERLFEEFSDSNDRERDDEDSSLRLRLLTDSDTSRVEGCIRQRKLLDIGYDVTGNRHYVDIGHCKHVSDTSNRDHQHQELRCPLRSVCEPTTLRTEKHFLLDGVTDVEVIDDCDCVTRPRSCSRLSRTVILHPDTPYERRVDVGHCRGPCGHGVSCKAVRNKTISLNGPNGFSCLNIIEECSCEGNCFQQNIVKFSIIESSIQLSIQLN